MDCRNTAENPLIAGEEKSPLRVLAAVADLLFVSKISTAAKQAGCTAPFFRDAEQLARAVPGEPCLVIVDLNHAALDPVALIARLKQNPVTAAAPVVAFLSHVQVDLKREAEKAGSDLVLPRSVFSQNLYEMLRQRSCHL